MIIAKKYTRLLLFILLGIFLLALELAWIYRTYQYERQQVIACATEAFELAYQKEQTYRIPVVDIINPGDITIQSCSSEEVLIIRKCPEPDTIVYNNISGHSIENFINRVFGDIRELIVPLNIYCLSDLFGGMLHDQDMPVLFVIERFNINTGEVLESSLLPNKEQPTDLYEAPLISISDTEAIRANLQLTPKVILGRMSEILITTVCLGIAILICGYYLYRCKAAKYIEIPSIEPSVQNDTFTIGKYHFDPAKNELQGFSEAIQLNKKENAILCALCMQQGKVVERSFLLEENWGSNGTIYSRSLDTYLTTLRKYLKQDPSVQIVTIKGVGYKLTINED